jgi:hypothetical protein
MSLWKDNIKMHVGKYSGMCGLDLPDLGWCEIAVPEKRSYEFLGSTNGWKIC